MRNIHVESSNLLPHSIHLDYIMSLQNQRPNFSTIITNVGLTFNVKPAQVHIRKKVFFMFSTLYIRVYLVVFLKMNKRKDEQEYLYENFVFLDLC